MKAGRAGGRAGLAAVMVAALAIVTVGCTEDGAGQSRNGREVGLPLSTFSDRARPPGDWPGPETTGVPEKVALQDFNGPCNVTDAGARIERKRVVCDLIIMAPAVRISGSETRRIEVGPAPASVEIEDSTVDAGDWVGAAVGLRAATLRRVEVRGGQHSVQCEAQCLVEDSWLHAQSLPQAEARHLNAFISNGGTGMTVRGSTLSCDPPVNAVDGGCTADLSLFGDFGPIDDVRVEGNLFRATPGGWCGSFGDNPGKPFGSSSSRVVVVNNVFERGENGKCGVFGAATSYLVSGSGNRWEGNVWEGGSVLEP